MPDISNILIKDSFQYILQCDLSTSVISRIDGDIPIDPKFISGITISSSFKFTNGNENDGYVLTSDSFGNGDWKPISGISSGISGSSGLSGISGSIGVSGISGLVGTIGLSGISGLQGLVGQIGQSGISGLSGLFGQSGISGLSGRSGISGLSGVIGISGLSGQSGQLGISGISGTIGISGIVGSNGVSGISGQSGLSGQSGSGGGRGESGISGLSGLIGIDGSNTRRFLWDGIASNATTPGTFVEQNVDNLTGLTYVIFNYYDYYGNDLTNWFSVLKNWVDVTGGLSSTDKMILQITKVSDNSIIGTWFGVAYYTDNYPTDILFKMGPLDITTNYQMQVGELYSFSWVLNGSDGISGLSGLSGEQGQIGNEGNSGISGLSGISGEFGTSGISGLSGTLGESGISGTEGLSGLSGINGISTTTLDTLNFVVDTGGAAPISSGLKTFTYLPYSGTILSWTLLSNNTGSTQIDIWKTSYSNFPPTVSDSIITYNPPTLTNQFKNQSNNLSGWTTNFVADDILGFYIVSATTLTRVQLVLTIQK